jgi:aminoglycoside N3'-acetyltransferase
MKEEIINQLKSLGIKNGDTLFITADLLKVGLFIKDRDTTFRTWFDILISLVGEQGTLVVPAYTPTFFRFGKSKEFLFKHDSPSTSGSLSVAFSKVSGVLRSTHPSNSCFAYGFNSDYILRDHNEFASSYLPYHKIIELGGKHLMLGCANDAKLGLMTIHPAQEILGITKKMWQCGLFQTYYFDKNIIQPFRSPWEALKLLGSALNPFDDVDIFDEYVPRSRNGKVLNPNQFAPNPALKGQYEIAARLQKLFRIDATWNYTFGNNVEFMYRNYERNNERWFLSSLDSELKGNKRELSSIKKEIKSIQRQIGFVKDESTIENLKSQIEELKKIKQEVLDQRDELESVPFESDIQ